MLTSHQLKFELSWGPEGEGGVPLADLEMVRGRREGEPSLICKWSVGAGEYPLIRKWIWEGGGDPPVPNPLRSNLGRTYRPGSIGYMASRGGLSYSGLES